MASPFFRFLSDSLKPIALFILALSLCLNMFLIVVSRLPDRGGDAQKTEEGESIGLVRGPLAFGTVAKGFTVRPVAEAPSASIPGVRGYTLTGSILPSLPPSFFLYRDQGIAADWPLVTSVLEALQVPKNTLPPHSFLKSMTLRSLDRSLDVLLDLENRVLMLTRRLPQPTSPPPSKKADDAEAIALARAFLATIGIDDTGTPVVVDEPASTTSPGRTFVVWYASLEGAPLLDDRLQPFARVTVQVGRVSHRVVAVLLSLLDPAQLTRSEYPTASVDVLTSGLRTGGVMPLPPSLSPKAPSATYESAELAYVITPATEQFPLYIVPIVRSTYRVPKACASCAMYTGQTYVPALSPASYSWLPGAAQPAR